MTTQQKAAFAAELEQWIQQNPGYTKNALTDWINQKLLELHRWLSSMLFVQFVWEGLTNGNGPLAPRCASVANDFSDYSVPVAGGNE
jgi:hypothetical protein